MAADSEQESLFGELPLSLPPDARGAVRKSKKSASAGRIEKSPSALRTIGEAASAIGVEQHVLRFWESKFSIITPLKMSGGRRYYRPEDMNILSKLKELLHEDGYSIKEAQAFFGIGESGGRASKIVKKQRMQLLEIYNELIKLRELVKQSTML